MYNSHTHTHIYMGDKGKLGLRKNEAKVIAMSLPGSRCCQGVGDKVDGSEDKNMAQWERSECSWYSQREDMEHPVWVTHSD